MSTGSSSYGSRKISNSPNNREFPFSPQCSNFNIPADDTSEGGDFKSTRFDRPKDFTISRFDTRNPFSKFCKEESNQQCKKIQTACQIDQIQIENSVPDSEKNIDLESGTANDHIETSNAKKIIKGIFISMLLCLFSFYVVFATCRSIFNFQHSSNFVSERDVYYFFKSANNDTRDGVLSTLLNAYRFIPDNEHLDLAFEGSLNVIEARHDNEIMRLMNNDNLKFMFSGISYSPKGVIEPKCECSQREVLLDIARLSTITNTVRTYGTQCDQAKMVLEAIKKLNLNMKLALGVWIGADNIINNNQIETMKTLLKEYPKEYFHSIFIGNEVLFRGDKTVHELMDYIKYTKNYLSSINKGEIPVGTSEVGSKIVAEHYLNADFVGANIHPFFAGIDAKDGTQWSLDYYYGQLIPFAEKFNAKTKLIISEIGWPYSGGTFHKAHAGASDFQRFLNDWLCTAPAEVLKTTFYFEAFDEPWKSIWWTDGKRWETEWGFFTSERQLKPFISIPDCSKLY